VTARVRSAASLAVLCVLLLASAVGLVLGAQVALDGPQTEQTWGVALVHYMAAAENAFVGFYNRRPWWRAWVGRALMTKSVGLMLLLDLAVVGYHVHYTYPQWVGLLVYGVIALGITGQLVVLLAVRNRRGDE
jgi:hypothetical protein